MIVIIGHLVKFFLSNIILYLISKTNKLVIYLILGIVKSNP